MNSIKKLSTAILCMFLLFHGIQLSATEKSYSFAELDKYEETYGNCIRTDEPFIIGSLSKSFTTMAIMQLVEDGKK